MNTRERVLKEALNCVNGEREKQYGNPEDNFRRIADLWSVYLTSLFEDEKIVVDIDSIDVAKMMILFKIARSNGDKDKLDNYIDMIGYAACAAEIFENDNEDKTDDYIQNPYSYFHDRLANYVSAKAKEEHIPLDNLKSIDRKLPRELEELLDKASKDCVAEGKYGGMKLLDYYKEIDELFAKYDLAEQQYQYFMKKNFGKEAQQWAESMKVFGGNGDGKEAVNELKVADECKDCDYAKKCMGTGVCLKEFDSAMAAWQVRHKKDKPDDKCNRKDCGQFDACMTAYQHYIYNKTKEANEAIDKCMCENNKNKKYSTSLLNIYNSISADILSFSTSANVDPFDIVGRLTLNGHAPTDMAALVLTGKLNIDCVVHYIEDAIHEVKKNSNPKEIDDKYVYWQIKDGRIYFNSKVTDNNKGAYRNSFNEAAEQMIQNLKANKKITRAVEVPEGFDISYIYMTDAGQIIVRFNPIEEDKK